MHPYLRSRSWRPFHTLTGALWLVLLACSGGKDDLAGPNPDPDPDPDPDPVVSSRIAGVITVSEANPSGAVLAAVGSPRPAKATRAQADAVRVAPSRAPQTARRKSAEGSSNHALGRIPRSLGLAGWARNQPRFRPDELIVTFRSAALSAPRVGAMAMTQRAVAMAIDLKIRSHLSAYAAQRTAEVRGVSPALLAARIKVRDPRLLGAVEAELRRDPAIATVERNGIHYGHGARATPAPRASATAANDPHYVRQAWHYAMIDLPQAWRLTTGSPGVLVAVVDDGIRFDHPDIAPNLTSDGYDFVDDLELPHCDGGGVSLAGDGDGDDPDPTIPASYSIDFGRGCLTRAPAFGHGLHVAGTIGAAGNNRLGGIGVNWAVRIRPVRVLGVTNTGDFWDVSQGIAYAAGLPVETESGEIVQATPGARIINVSIGAVEESAVEKNAVIAATDAGALVVASAGNEATSEPRYPAAFPEVLAVSAVGPDGRLASYSNYGSTIDLAAPGGDYSEDGDIENGDFSFGVFSTVWNFDANAPAYTYFEGTSMAAPHVTGVAALLLAQNPSMSAAELRARLLDFAVDAGTPGPDQQYGAGILNARNSLTQSLEPQRRTFARLYHAATGALVQSIATQANGAYVFDELDDGEYHVFGGQDEDDDAQIGLPGRRWGAFGAPGIATTLTVAGGGEQLASFSIGMPAELEPNDGFADAHILYPGGYLAGSLDAQDVDVARVLVRQAGEYTFETSARRGACGFALEGDTILKLYDANGGLITSNDDIDSDAGNYCSRITAILAAGTYHVAVESFSAAGGRYYLQARQGT